MIITSTSNPRVKAAIRLRDRRGRDDQGRIVIDGVREIERAIAAGVAIAELFYLGDLCQDKAHQDLLKRARSAGVELIELTWQVMEKLSFGNRAEGVVAIGPTPRRALADLVLAPDALIVVVEGVEKPGNLGAVLRTADAAAASGLIVADGGTDLHNPNAIRASLGAIFTVPVCQAGAAETLDWLRAGGFRILAARVDGANEYTQADFRSRTAIALGSEARGLGELWRGQGITSIKLPMLGQVDSLNLSATAAVLLYEALRQRRSRGRTSS
jgi:TrmH family RNA methyltransferase